MKRILPIILVFSSLILVSFSLPRCASKEAGVWRSDDGGNTWAQRVTIDQKNDIASLNVLRIIFDPTDPQKVYLGSKGNGMYKSDNGGDTWQKTKINKGDVWDISPDPEDGNIVYVAVLFDQLGRVYATYDGGENWEAIFVDSIVESPVYNVRVDWHDHNNIIVTTGWGGVLQSRDQGQTWEKIAEIGSLAGRLSVSDTDSRTMWYTTPTEGIFETRDGGHSWEEIALLGLEDYPGASRVYDLEIDRNSDTFYLATAYGLLISEDEGRSWQPIKTLTPFGVLPFYAVAVNPVDSGEIFFTIGNTVFKSVNQGETWKLHKVHTGEAIRYIEYHPEKPEVIYLGIRRLE